MSIFVNCTIENPAFSSQTKDCLTTKALEPRRAAASQAQLLATEAILRRPCAVGYVLTARC